MSWTQADIAAQETKIKTLVRSAQKGDRSVTYNSMEEELKLLDVMKESFRISTGGATRCTYGSFSKG